jgi:hypothetical protein
MNELLRLVEALRTEVAALRAENTVLRSKNAELEAKVAELQLELARRNKGFRPKANTSTRKPSTDDRRKAARRTHPGSTRPEPPVDENTVHHHEVTADTCPALPRFASSTRASSSNSMSKTHPCRASKFTAVADTFIRARVVTSSTRPSRTKSHRRPRIGPNAMSF